MSSISSLLRLIFVLSLSMVLIGCTSKQNKVVIVLTEGPAAVSLIHMMQSVNEIDGRTIEYVIRQEPLQIQALMMQNKADFAILPTVMAVNLYNKGIEYQLMGVPVWGTLYLLGNVDCNDLSCLENEVVYVFGRGTTADILTRYFLESKGLSHVQINYQYASNQELALALLHGRIKFAVISEPLVSQILVTNTRIGIISPVEYHANLNGAEINVFAQTAFLVSKRFGLRYPEITNQIEEWYRSSCYLSMSEPDSTARLLLKHELFTAQKMDIAAILRCRINYRKADEMREILPIYLQLYKRFDPESIGGRLPDDNFFYVRKL